MRTFDFARLHALRPFVFIVPLIWGLASTSHANLYSVTTGGINVINPNTGALLNSFAAPVTPQTAGGSGLAFSGTTLYYSTITSPSIYVINPASGAVSTSFLAPLTGIDALGYGTSSFGNTLFALDYTGNRLYWLNPIGGVAFKSVTLSFDAVGGIDFNTARGTLYVSDGTGVIRELNPDDASILNSFTTGTFQTGLGFVGGRMFTSSQNGTLIEERNPLTGLVVGSFLSPGGSAGALAGTPVPEPSAFSLLAFGLVALISSLTRKREVMKNHCVSCWSGRPC